MYRLTDYGAMLRDERRIEARRRALAAVLTPTSTVLDLGCGLGTFSILACQLGAARVYAVDAADVIHVANENARANGVADRIEFIQARATDVELPERVDVIVSDLGGALPLFHEHIPTIIHAREQFLAPGGTLIPRRDRLWCAPVTSAELYARIAEPWRSIATIDFAPAATMAMHSAYPLPVAPDDLAAPPQQWGTLDYATITSPNVTADVTWTIPADAAIHGIALWFESELHDGITSSSGPWSPGSVHATMVLPLLSPLEMRAGETLRVAIEATLVDGRYVMTWQVQQLPRQSTFLGEPVGWESRKGSDPFRALGSDPAATFRIPERVLSRQVGGELVLLHLTTGMYHVLNETGARVWELLTRGEGTERIAAALAEDYEVQPEQAAADVSAVIAELREAKLIDLLR